MQAIKYVHTAHPFYFREVTYWPKYADFLSALLWNELTCLTYLHLGMGEQWNQSLYVLLSVKDVFIFILDFPASVNEWRVKSLNCWWGIIKLWFTCDPCPVDGMTIISLLMITVLQYICKVIVFSLSCSQVLNHICLKMIELISSSFPYWISVELAQFHP